MQKHLDLFSLPHPQSAATGPAREPSPLTLTTHDGIPSYRLQLVTERHIPYAAATKLRTPQCAAAFLRPILCAEPRELFAVLMLSNANSIIGLHIASAGGIASAIVEPRQVFQAAILANAAAIICAHNHPSGNPEPSGADITVTEKIREAGAMLEIPLRDHIIITADTHTSLAERGHV